MDFLIHDRFLFYYVGVVLLLVVVLPFVLREIRKKREAKKLVHRIVPISRLPEERVRAIKSRHPSGKTMFPSIIKSVCVGCGSCVSTCPEKGCLCLIDGKSTLVDPTVCYGCGECERSCPSGANRMVEYGCQRKIRAPEIDEHFESNVKGIYVIGSLAGAGLIKEAINQGRAVLNHIMRDVYPDRVPRILVIGAGPAGLSALLSCQKFGLPAVCLEKEQTANTIRNFPKRKVVMAEPVEMPLFGPLWIGQSSREKLLEVWDKILAATKAPVTTGAKIESLSKRGDEFVVTASGREYVGDIVILALGTRGVPRKLNVPGECLGKVFYGLSDAKEFTGKRVAVVGAGDAAIETALALRNQGCEVTLIVRGDGFPKAKAQNLEKIEAAIRGGLMRPYFNSRVLEVKPESLVVSSDGGTSEIANDDAFVLIGGELPFDLLEKIGIRIVEKSL